MRVLSWNLFHGRAVPERPRSLLAEFTAALAGWEWDVALLQEVPPWWPQSIAPACGAAHRTAPTARNLGQPVRRWVAERRPDLIKSNGGGANAILVRGPEIVEHRVRRLRRCPERRVVHAVRLDDGAWVGNLHAQVRPHSETRKDVALAAATILGWAPADVPVVLGGDFNVPDPERDLPAAPLRSLPTAEWGQTPFCARGQLRRIPGSRGVDHVLARGLVGTAGELVRAGGLSDHAPVLARLG